MVIGIAIGTRGMDGAIAKKVAKEAKVKNATLFIEETTCSPWYAVCTGDIPGVGIVALIEQVIKPS